MTRHLSNGLRTIPQIYCMANFEWKKSKHEDLAHQSGFGSTFLHRMLRLAKDTSKPKSYYWLAWWFDCSRWVAIRSFPSFCSLNFNLMGEVGKKQIELILNVRNILASAHTQHGWNYWPYWPYCLMDLMAHT